MRHVRTVQTPNTNPTLGTLVCARSATVRSLRLCIMQINAQKHVRARSQIADHILKINGQIIIDLSECAGGDDRLLTVSWSLDCAGLWM